MRTRLKDARRASSLNQQQAAEALDVSIGTYRNWEQGRVVMNGEQLIRAASLFGTSVDYILMTDVEPVPYVEPVQEITGLYDSMDDDGRYVLLLIARTLATAFPRE